MREDYARPWMPAQSRADVMRTLLAKAETDKTRPTWRESLWAWLRGAGRTA